jgi:trimeric autotransporter adhesin
VEEGSPGDLQGVLSVAATQHFSIMAKVKGGGVTKRMKKFQQKGGLGGIQKAIDKKREVRSIKRRQADRETNRAERAKALKEQVPQPAAPRASLPGSITKAEYLECPWLYGQQDPDDFDQLDAVTAASAAALPKGAKKSKSLTAEAVHALSQIALTDPPTAAQFDTLRALVRAFHGTASSTCADVLAKAACTAGSPEAALLSTVCLTQLLAPATEQQHGEGSSDGAAAATSSTTTATAAARLARLQAHARMPRSEHWQALHGSLRRLCLAALDAVACEAGLSSESASSSSDSLRALFPLLIAFPGLAKEWLRRLLEVAVSTDSADVALRALRTCTQLALSQPVPFLQSTLKAAYMAYRAAADRLEQRLDDSTDSRSSSSTQQQLTPASAVAAAPAVLQALRQGLSELYSHEPSASYLHAYVYLHLLAARVEAAESVVDYSTAAAALSEVRSWTFLQSVLLWAQVVAAGIAAPRLTAPAAGADAASDSSGATLRALVQPLCQIIERAVKLCPGAASLPHRLALARAAQDLAAAAGVFVPNAWMAFGALDFDSLYSSTSSNSSSSNTADAAAAAVAVEQQQQTLVDLCAVARLTREQLKARTVRRSVLAAATALLQREAALYSQSPGYPEYAQAMARRLTAAAAHLEDTAAASASSGSAAGLSGKMRSAAEGMLKKSSAVERVRAKGSAHPGGVAALDALKPQDGDSAAVRLAKAVPSTTTSVKSVKAGSGSSAAGSSKHKKRRQKKAAATADQ